VGGGRGGCGRWVGSCLHEARSPRHLALRPHPPARPPDPNRPVSPLVFGGGSWWPGHKSGRGSGYAPTHSPAGRLSFLVGGGCWEDQAGHALPPLAHNPLTFNISIPPSERLDGLPPAASPLTPNHKL